MASLPSEAGGSLPAGTNPAIQPSRSVLVVFSPHSATASAAASALVRLLVNDLALPVSVEVAPHTRRLQRTYPVGVVQFGTTAAPACGVVMVFCLGGDGTVLHAAGLFSGAVPPIVALSCGSLGFLAPFQRDAVWPLRVRRIATALWADSAARWDDGVDGKAWTGAAGGASAVAAGLTCTTRVRLACDVEWAGGESCREWADADQVRSRHSSGVGVSTSCLSLTGSWSSASSAASVLAAAAPAAAVATGATSKLRDAPLPLLAPVTAKATPMSMQVLNDVVIDRGGASSLTNLEIFADGVFVTRVQADGLILATPTGSTAYSAGAGGALVHPSVAAILLTPVCPHALSFRPAVLPATIRLRVVVAAASRASAVASFDGRSRVTLSAGDALAVTASRWPVMTVDLASGAADWFGALSGCLRWNEGRPTQKALKLGGSMGNEMGEETELPLSDGVEDSEVDFDTEAQLPEPPAAPTAPVGEGEGAKLDRVVASPLAVTGMVFF
ncbi:hypothetical protein MMPV_003453 [Pyropia vietnamensis]